MNYLAIIGCFIVYIFIYFFEISSINFKYVYIYVSRYCKLNR